MRSFDKSKGGDTFILKAFQGEEEQPDDFVLRSFDRKTTTGFLLKAFDKEEKADKDRKTEKAPETRSVLSAYVPPRMRDGHALRSFVAKLPAGVRAEFHGSMLMTVECGKSDAEAVGDLLVASGLQWQED